MSLSSPPTGPVEWVALSFPGAALGSGVAGPLADLVRAGTVRVLDAVVVHKAADGTVTEGEIADESAAFDDVDGDVLELLSHDDLRSIAERLEERHHDTGPRLGEPVGDRLRRGAPDARRLGARPRPGGCRGRRGRARRAERGPVVRRGLGRGRRGPGLLGTMARTAVVAGTAQAVAGRVAQGQQAAANRDQQAAAAQEQLRQAQQQAQVDAQVAQALRAQAPPVPPPPSAPPVPLPAPAARPSVDELHAQLMKLGELRQAGLLTDEEFAEQKARLLG